MADKTHSGGARSALRHFVDSEAAGGIVLIVAAGLAMITANSGLDDLYHRLLHVQTGAVLSAKLGPMTPQLWINDGLMALFFLFVGLEIKREFLDGRLSTWDRRRLPVIAAAVGMIMPALLYLAIAADHPELHGGWAIPAATDIAFAIAVLALLGRRVPAPLKLFLITVAIADDLGAVAIIALAYTEQLNTVALGAAAAVLVALYAVGKSGVARLWVYLLGGALLWYAILLSGVHATVAGVLTASAVPILKTPGAPDSSDSPLHRLEHGLAPWVAFVIVPLFGFANAGVSMAGLSLGAILAPLPLAIAVGLFFGKQIGIFSAVWLSVRLGFARPLEGATWLQLYAVSVLCGIGFTMSLFIGALAFPHQPALIEEAKIGILLGSLVSAAVGYLVFRFAPAHPAQRGEELRLRGDRATDLDIVGAEEGPRHSQIDDKALSGK